MPMISFSAVCISPPKRPGRLPYSPSGFTLLEILLAIFIFSVMITMIFSTFNAVVSRTQAIKDGCGDYEMARTCLNRMASDLSALYVDVRPLYKPRDVDDDPDLYGFVGKEDNLGGKDFAQLRFASTEHLPMNGKPEKGIAQIVYYVQETGYPDTTYNLKRSDTLHFDTKRKEFEKKAGDPVLCQNLESLRFIYTDQDGQEMETWDSDASDSKYATPRAVEIRLQIASGEDVLRFGTKILLPVYREKIE